MVWLEMAGKKGGRGFWGCHTLDISPLSGIRLRLYSGYTVIADGLSTRLLHV